MPFVQYVQYDSTHDSSKYDFAGCGTMYFMLTSHCHAPCLVDRTVFQEQQHVLLG